MTDAAVILVGYLLGSMPFGYWVVRLTKGVDVRTVGSGNIGATNVWRAYGKGYGVPIVVLDVAKGLVPALAGSIVGGALVGVLAGSAAMLGHWRPLFLGFQRGGKTVATAGGTLFGAAPVLGLIAVLVWLVVFLLCRYASVASIVTAFAMPVAALLFGEDWPIVVFAAVAGVAVVVLHKANISRLRSGTESRFLR